MKLTLIDLKFAGGVTINVTHRKDNTFPLKTLFRRYNSQG